MAITQAVCYSGSHAPVMVGDIVKRIKGVSNAGKEGVIEKIINTRTVLVILNGDVSTFEFWIERLVLVRRGVMSIVEALCYKGTMIPIMVGDLTWYDDVNQNRRFKITAIEGDYLDMDEIDLEGKIAHKYNGHSYTHFRKVE